LAEIADMHAENQQRQRSDYSPAYVEEQFAAVIDRYGISHDAVLRIFEEAGP
jgi:hypothetical protein